MRGRISSLLANQALKVVAFGSAARVFGLASQFVVLLVLNWIMDKATFGNMMIVFALYRMIALALGTGFGNMILFHVGRNSGDSALDTRLHRSVSLLALAVSLSLAIVCVVFSRQIASLFSKPDLSVWLVNMSPFLVFSTLNLVAMGSLDGRSRITKSIVITEVMPNALRLFLLPLIGIFSLSAVWAAHVMWIALALPWLYEVRPLLRHGLTKLEPLTLWDLRYSGLYAASSIASQQLQGLDMIVIGLLFSSEQAAGYAIAVKFATLMPFFQMIILKSFTPRAGALLRSSSFEKLNAELAEVRQWSIISVGFLSGFILLVSPVLLGVMGNYQDQIKLLAVLALAVLTRSFFAGNAVILQMSGQAGWSLKNALLSSFIIIAFAFPASSILGVQSVSTGILLSSLIVSPLVAYRMRSLGVVTFNRNEFALVIFILITVLNINIFISNFTYSGIISGIVLIFMATSRLITKYKFISIHFNK